MKLYKHVSRFRFRKHVSKYREKRIKWALSLKPGDLINDCSGYNVIIRAIEPDVWSYNNGWFIGNVDFCVEPFGGRCSLNHCGVEPPLPRDVVEQRTLEFNENWFAGGLVEPGTAAYWFGGADKDDYKKAFNLYQRKLEAVKTGGHFTTERGELLPEFR